MITHLDSHSFFMCTEIFIVWGIHYHNDFLGVPQDECFQGNCPLWALNQEELSFFACKLTKPIALCILDGYVDSFFRWELSAEIVR